jgi:uncharacterized damage-inducible protein DinB
MSEITRPEPPYAAAEQDMLDGFLLFLQQTLLIKIDGLDDEQLRRPMVPTGMCLLGLIKHQAYVHRWWFRMVFAGEDVAAPWTREDPDADWRIEPDDTTTAIVALYKDEIAKGRAITQASADLDALPNMAGRPQTLRWILVHMVEEVARHCGHADILRELIDGKTGE